MDANFTINKRFFFCTLTILLVGVGLLAAPVRAAGARTQNFLVEAPTAQLARTVSEAAEKYRHDLAVYWLGRELPPWSTPCPIRVIAGDHLAAQGVTTFNRSPVRDFQMEVVGTPQRILDSVLPHEVTHTVLATHFGRPLPRWADEGICTTVEHPSEKNKHEAKLREFLNNRRGIAMNKLFLLTEYPTDVLPMYAQGYSVCRFLIEQKDAPTFIAFLTDYMERPSWTENIRKHYGYESLAELQNYWLGWVSEGSGPVGKFAKIDRRSEAPTLGSPTPAEPKRGMVAQVSNETAADATLSGDPKWTPPPIDSPPTSAMAHLDATEGYLPMPRRLQAPENARPTSGTEPSSTTLASRSNDGWYHRKKQGAHQTANANSPRSNPSTPKEAASWGTPGAASPSVTPMMPPSVRRSGPYSVSQPQPEMQMSRRWR